MTRDEILADIERLSWGTNPDPQYAPGLDELQANMRAVVALADEYITEGRGDVQYIAEALGSALASFADMLQPYA